LDEAQATAAKSVLDVVSSVKASDATRLIESLDTEQQCLLMKYIYRGFAHPESFNCNVLLAWHEKVNLVASL
jgi:hypothetical protein